MSSDQVFLLPDLGEGLTEAEVVRWLVSEGDVVAIDQAVAEVETAKSIVEVPTPYAGVVAVLHGAEGQTIAVGTPLITVRSAGASSGDALEVYREEEQAGSGNVLIGYGTSRSGSSGRRRAPRASVVASQAKVAQVARVADPARRPVPLVISPLVRSLARESRIDLSTLVGSGTGGLITRADVQRAIGQGVPAAGLVGERRTPMSGFRKTVSNALSRSRAEIPEATVWVDVDATELVALREAARLPDDPGPGLLTYLARFTIDALQAYPMLNGRVDAERDELVEFSQVNLGLAVQAERGLVVPAVIGADRMTTVLLDEAIKDLTARARQGKATAEELTAGTFTLNNYGGFNVDGSAAIINHPQVAIVGFGRIIDRPWVVDGQIVVRKVTQMSFVFDHRVCDGGTAAGFMRHIADAVERPLPFLARL